MNKTQKVASLMDSAQLQVVREHQRARVGWLIMMK